jgi:hypothetical protein
MDRKQKPEEFTSVAEILSHAMKEQGVAIRDLAIKLGITYEHTRRVVGGDSIPTKWILKPICEELGLNFEALDKLATGEKIRKKYGVIPDDVLARDPSFVAVEKLWKQLNETQRHDMISMMQGLARGNRKPALVG